MVVAPTRPERIYLGTATGHLYVSNDGAGSWSLLPIELGHDAVVDNLLVHPGNEQIVFAAYWLSTGSGGLVRTRDGGATWERLPVAGQPSLRAIAMAPTAPDTLYIGGVNGVWRSNDGGNSWTPVAGHGLAADFVESLAIDPRDAEHVYAGTWRQVYRSRDGGANWNRVYAGMAIDRDVFSLAISPHDPETVFAGTCNFLYCSTDAGGKWGERREGLIADHNRVHAIVHHPIDPQTLYAGTRGALYRSDDGGNSWSLVVGGVAVTALSLTPTGDRIYIGTEERGVLVGGPDGDFEERNQGIGSSRVIAFDALPGAPRVLFAVREDGPVVRSLHLSTDVGQTWRRLGVAPGTGAQLTVRAQARPVNHVMVAGADGWWSVDPGGSWSAVAPPPGALAALEIAHEADGAVVAVGTSGLHVADPRALTGGATDSLPFNAAAAPIWKQAWSSPLTALAIAGDNMLAVGSGRAVRASIANLVAGEDPMVAATKGLPDDIRDLALHPTDASIVYAIGPHEVFRSSDFGASWEQLPLPWPGADLRDIVVDPARPDQVLALDHRGSLYRGHGEGQYWLVLDDDEGLHRAWSLLASPQAPGYAIVATQGHGLRVVALDPSSAAPR